MPAAILEHPSVTGIALRATWSQVEPREGQFDWSYFEREIARAAKAGKRVSLRVIAGGKNTPGWVMSLPGVETFSFKDPNPYHKTAGQEVTLPVFWNPVFLAKKKALIKAWGARFAGERRVTVVGAACANANTGDWSVPAGTDAEVQRWKRLGYSAEKLIEACKDTVDATAAAFPEQVVLLSIGETKLDADHQRVATAVVDHGYARHPGRFMVIKSTLSARTPDPGPAARKGGWSDVHRHRPMTGAQMLWSVTNDTTFRMNGRTPAPEAQVFARAMNASLTYGLSYLEVYERDLLNPDLRDIVEQTATMLTRERDPGPSPRAEVARPRIP